MFEQRWKAVCTSYGELQRTWLRLAMMVNFPNRYDGSRAFWEATRCIDRLVDDLALVNSELESFRQECVKLAVQLQNDERKIKQS